MYDELTKKDIELMQQELDHRRLVLRPQLIEAVKEARAFGDLSENFEYKAAKKEKNLIKRMKLKPVYITHSVCVFENHVIGVDKIRKNLIWHHLSPSLLLC